MTASATDLHKEDAISFERIIPEQRLRDNTKLSHIRSNMNSTQSQQLLLHVVHILYLSPHITMNRDHHVYSGIISFKVLPIGFVSFRSFGTDSNLSTRDSTTASPSETESYILRSMSNLPDLIGSLMRL